MGEIFVRSLRAFLYRRVPWRVALAVVIVCPALLAVAGWRWCCLGQARLEGDTPEVCRVYLEQNAFVLSHFGHLRKARFQADQSCAFPDGEHGGWRQGVYVYAVAGTRAEGKLKVVWSREPGDQGSFAVSYLQIVECRLIDEARPALAVPRQQTPREPPGESPYV